MNHYEWLIGRLDAFIRKYYLNQLLRGLLVLLGCLLFFILLVSVGEYFLYLPSWVRIGLVVFFILSGSFALLVWILLPLLKMFHLRKGIGYEQAAAIIGRHFPEVSDQLLNMLQLKKQAGDPVASRELIAASIEQKAARIVPVPITQAVNLKGNRRYLKYILPLVFIAVMLLIFSPAVFTDASQRLLQPTRSFEKPAPFRFHILTDPLEVVTAQDFTLKIRLTGKALPASVAIQTGDQMLTMYSDGKDEFRYVFRNVSAPVRFRFSAAGFYSRYYQLEVKQPPVLRGVKVQLDYPAYTGKTDEIKTSLGDMTLPAGTRVSWSFQTQYTDQAQILFDSGRALQMLKKQQAYTASAQILQDTSYHLVLYNKHSGLQERYGYKVLVIPDEYPTLQVEEMRDTVTGKQIVLHGIAGDDYGISSVLFHYMVSDPDGREVSSKAVPLQITKGVVTGFRHYFDVDMLSLSQGHKLSYYIEAWDNDGVHGRKATKSEVMSYYMYTKSQLDSAMQVNATQISSGMSQSSKQAKQLLREITQMQHKMLQEDQPGWEQQQAMQDMAQRQEQLYQLMEQTRKRFEEQIQQSKQKNYSEDVREKQEMLKEQLDNLLDKELKEQMKKLEELLARMNRENKVQAMQQMEQENKLFQMDLQRMQELMNKLEMQMRMEDMADKLEKLGTDQLSLREETEKGQKQTGELAQEQDHLKKELDKLLEKDMEEMQDLNEKLGQQQPLEDMAQDGKDAGSQMEESKQELNKGNKEKSGAKQQQAAENLQQMAASLRTAAGGMDMEQISLDIRAVRQLLTNLIRLSFDQETLMEKVRTTSPASREYLVNQEAQNRLHRHSRMIRDSLFSLSKRIFTLAPAINKETAAMEQHLKASVKAIEDRNTGLAATRQQYVMTHANNLALMLNETLSNLMQMQSQSQSEKEGSCSNPGGKKPKPGAGQQLNDIITKQQELGDAFKQMQDAQKKRGSGGKTGEGMSEEENGSQEGGRQQGSGGSGNAEQLARIARQQAMIRAQLQELQRVLNSKGMAKHGEAIKEIQDNMDKMETDLVNKRLSQELLLRQRAILTRLLETQKAVREQEEDDQRSATEGKELARPVPPELKKHLRDRQQLLELYKTVPAQLKPYYRNMVENYYLMLRPEIK